MKVALLIMLMFQFMKSKLVLNFLLLTGNRVVFYFNNLSISMLHVRHIR